jgi:hypothetical protein
MIITDKTIQHKETVHALIALMFINASRFKARQDKGAIFDDGRTGPFSLGSTNAELV